MDLSPQGLLILGLGCNLPGLLGSPQETMDWVIGKISAEWGPLIAAPIYRSVALDRRGDPLPGQPEYLNTVVVTGIPEITPEDALRKTQEWELLAGRDPVRKIDAARPLDIDLLIWGRLNRQDVDPVIPHPRMRERRFVLRPLVDLTPHLLLPPDDVPASELLARLGETQELEPVHKNCATDFNEGK